MGGCAETRHWSDLGKCQTELKTLPCCCPLGRSVSVPGDLVIRISRQSNGCWPSVRARLCDAQVARQGGCASDLPSRTRTAAFAQQRCTARGTLYLEICHVGDRSTHVVRRDTWCGEHAPYTQVRCTSGSCRPTITDGRVECGEFSHMHCLISCAHTPHSCLVCWFTYRQSQTNCRDIWCGEVTPYTVGCHRFNM